MPVGADEGSLGCGNPTDVAELRTGERVLDLGSGGGLDVLLSARRVGETGFASGVDMTGEMLALAEEVRRLRAGRGPSPAGAGADRPGFADPAADPTAVTRPGRSRLLAAARE